MNFQDNIYQLKSKLIQNYYRKVLKRKSKNATKEETV